LCDKQIKDEAVLMKAFMVSLLMVLSCQKSPVVEEKKADVILIGAGIMSATLGSLLRELDPNLTIEAFERLDNIGLESSGVLNNAGTGHSAYCELNYTPEKPDGTIDTKKAVDVFEAFELSMEYWAYLARKGELVPESFIHNVPHMSFVWGDKNIEFLKKRHQALIKYPFFADMEYSENNDEIKKWVPLVIKGRDENQKIAATRMKAGVDINFEALTRGLFKILEKAPNFKLNLNYEVRDLIRNKDQTWTVTVKDLKTEIIKNYRAKFIFVGAGGAALTLLQKSQIPEGKGFGGFPVGGVWLVTDNQKLIAEHDAKVYGQASVGSPPMSVPHLDTRYIINKRSLLFGPFATYSTKFLKNGSWLDLPASITLSNIIPILEAGFHNINLVSYLIGQVLMSKEKRLESLKEYFPEARLEDWYPVMAGQRVQVIKNDPEKGGVLQFGTEVVVSQDGSIAALLGASPGASIAVKIMLEILSKSFGSSFQSPSWQNKLKEMIPSYKTDMLHDPELKAIQARDRKILKLEY
jgi:malate dehydrogenase (quinone)